MEQTISFEQAIAQSEQLLAAYSSKRIDDAQLSAQVAELVRSSNGARGFFVTFLSGDWAVADAPGEALLAALRTAPERVAELMTRNLAMSTAMILAHRERGDARAALGSEQVATRSRNLIARLALPELNEQIALLKQALGNHTGPYAAFLDRWGYNNEQKKAIAIALESLRI